MIISICQPHFLPWIGYFIMLKRCDKFIYLDDVNYNRRSWQNRCHILNPNLESGKQLISLSIKSPSRDKKINETFVKTESIERLIRQIHNIYRKAKFFELYFKDIEKILIDSAEDNLSKININLINYFSEVLEIKTKKNLSSSFLKKYKKENLILEILQRYNAKTYLANEGSLNYAGDSFFKKHNINFEVNRFIHPKYNQIKNLFIPNLSIIDLIFFNGEDSKNYL